MSMKVMEILNVLSNISATISIDNFLKTAYQNVSIEKSETFFHISIYSQSFSKPITVGA